MTLAQTLLEQRQISNGDSMKLVNAVYVRWTKQRPLLVHRCDLGSFFMIAYMLHRSLCVEVTCYVHPLATLMPSAMLAQMMLASQLKLYKYVNTMHSMCCCLRSCHANTACNVLWILHLQNNTLYNMHLYADFTQSCAHCTFGAGGVSLSCACNQASLVYASDWQPA